MRERISYKTKGSAVALCFFLGGLGAHKYYTGKVGMGLLYSCFFWTFIPGILACIDLIFLLCTSKQDFDNNVNFINK